MGLPSIDHLDVWVDAHISKGPAGRGATNSKKFVGIEALKNLIQILAINGRILPSNSNWETHKFGEKFELLYGKNLPKKKRSETGEFPVYGSNGVVGTHEKAFVTAPCLVIGRKGSAGAINRCDETSCWVTDVAYYFIPPADFDLRYCEILFSTLQLDTLGKGIKPGLNRNEAYELEISFPNFSEQKRIVAKVDELMGIIDDLEAQTDIAHERRAELTDALLRALVESEDADALAQNWKTLSAHFDTLFTTEESVEKLKAAILDLAVRGKLVDTSPNEKAADLNLVESERTKNNVRHKFQEKKTNISLPFDVPDNWHEDFLGNVMLKITDGTHHSPPNGENGEHLYISAKNIKSHGVLTSNATYVSQKIHDEIYSRCDPELGDILYIKDGATTGIGTINDLTEPFSMLSSVALLKPSSITLNSFILYLMRSPYFYDAMRAKMSGVAITRVTLKKLNEAVIPLPPYEEQKRIVAKVDEIMTFCDNLLENIRAAEALKVELAESVVHHASANSCV